jgi:hypothetical protein
VIVQLDKLSEIDSIASAASYKILCCVVFGDEDSSFRDERSVPLFCCQEDASSEDARDNICRFIKRFY